MRADGVNWLLFRAIAVLISYCAVGSFSPKPYFSSVIGMFAIMMGGMMFVRYMRASYEILVNERRGEFGGHIAVLGAASIGFGLVFSGLFRILWGYYGSPPEWTGTSISSFGLFMIVLGSYLIAKAPEAAQVRHKFPTALWQNAIIIMAIIAAFVAGTHFSDFQ